ncbi:hypothetical protein ACOZ4I_05350 [Haloarcula salina]|uniref:DUF5789 family protein n=1 Tax=Haloarcula salina TaxID=1429914 RepID=UPI003C6F8F42
MQTPMRYSETHQLFEQACEFPADHDTVVRQLGDVELTSQTGDSVTVREILALTDETTYRTPEDLYTSLVGNLGDPFIGRKYYDDRAGSTSGTKTVRSDVDML